ncbi:molybdopterin-dependent oxidoreductase [Parendozoicomonas sp. Alg238-R29]|uniref:molybdopterin-dependent oxidoreductase n=1 Tax=Parendozoicomonas sp. Alg238-R29 TaxID=2993446 RepID=UPI00248EDB3C|nr:molybdopterin-dependent oxidoreductase [Parendozoicomonas sp. Alg238-R29]
MANATAQPVKDPEFKKSSCALCSINCGLEIKTGGKDGRELLKIRGDKDNPASEGYLCNKAARLNYYQMGADRLNTPMRRKPDGTYEAVSWDVAIKEVAAGLKGIQQKYGGEKILFIGGGGQGNHLGGAYSDAILKYLGVKYRTNALAQEKTGEFWVAGKMFGGGPHGDFDHTEVAVFIGKNPWQAHGFPQSRKVLREIAKDPKRSMVVLDPCLTDTAKLADFHLQLKPGTDAWCISALIATIIQEGLEDKAFIEQHTKGFEEIRSHFETLSIAEYAAICELDEELIRKTARRIATAQSAAVFEDLGVQQNLNSTVVSYLQRIMYVITGNFSKKGANNIAVPFVSVTDASKGDVSAGGNQKVKLEKVSPVLGSKIITGLIPCNTIPDEILTDHPNRFRAAFIESSNPVHSYANSVRMREAMQALEFSVVVDVAMTETARQANYVLPASSSYEKYECVFFSVEFPRNFFQLRQPVVDPLPGTLMEAEIHTRILEELGGLKKSHVRILKAAAKLGHKAFAAVFMPLLAMKPELMKVAAPLMYRTLGPTLKGGKAASTAFFWALSHQFVRKNSQYAANAGFTGSKWAAGEKMFDAVLNKASGFVFSDSRNYEDSWKRMRQPDKRIQLYLKELYPQMTSLDVAQLKPTVEFPLVLTAGQRRAETANTIIRDASWDKKNKIASLYIHPQDAEKLELENGEDVKITTKTGTAETHIEITTIQRPGFISLPNGVGLDYRKENGEEVRVGVSPNELTSSSDRDFFAGTPWHKYVPARVEKIA